MLMWVVPPPPNYSFGYIQKESNNWRLEDEKYGRGLKVASRAWRTIKRHNLCLFLEHPLLGEDVKSGGVESRHVQPP